MRKNILFKKGITFFIIGLLFSSGFGLISVATTVKDGDYDFIILTPTDFSSDLQPLVDHKELHGITTKIVTLDDIYDGVYFPTEGRDDAEKIKYFIKNSVENWSIKYVMLVGGKDDMPVRFARIYLVTGDYSYYISDLYYADIYFANGSFCSWDSNNDGIFADKNESGFVDEVDLYPDVRLGRILCSTESEVATVVDKIITYETTSYNQDWFKNLVVCGGDDARGTFKEALLPFLLHRSGHIVFEGEYLGNQAAKILSDFTSKKIYASGLFRPNIRMLTRENINDAINNGAGFLMFNGHGNIETAMITNFPFCRNIWLPRPSGYKSSDIQNLQNGYKLPVAIFGGCFCGDFNASASPVAWEFIRHTNGGAIASFACTSGSQMLLSSLCTESLHGHIIMSIFESYAEGIDIVGEIWDDSITNYLNDEDALKLGDDFSMLNWGDKLSNHFILEEWVLFGDPTLTIGGYP